MVKVMYNDYLVYKVVIWAFFGISLWTEKVALIKRGTPLPGHVINNKILLSVYNEHFGRGNALIFYLTHILCSVS